MTIPLTGDQGLFTRIGAIASTIALVNDQQAGSIVTAINVLAAEFDGNRPLVDSLQSQLASYQQGQLSLPEFLQTVAQNTVISMVNADVPQDDSTLATALVELITQMQAAEQTVEENTCSYIIAPDLTNNSDASVMVSTHSFRGNPLQNLYAEDITLTVTTDSQEGAAALGQEVFTAATPVAATSKLDASWPMGSGATVTFTAIDASVSNGTNLLTNGDFSQVATETAANWTLESGNVTQADVSLSACISGYGLQFIGDGASTFAVSQAFNSSTGTPAALRPLVQYAVNLWVRVGSVPAAGQLTVELVDANTGLVVPDDVGTPNSFIVLLSALEANTCTPVGEFFRTPRVLPTNLKLRLRLNVALSNGVVLTMDHAAMAEATELYTHGPWLAIFSGSRESVREDNWVITIENDRAGLIQTFGERLFDMNDKRLMFPIDAASTSPTIPNSLFT